jgi:hypothetical protein
MITDQACDRSYMMNIVVIRNERCDNEIKRKTIRRLWSPRWRVFTEPRNN